MSELLALPNYVETVFADNAYFTDIDWLHGFRAKELARFMQRGFPGAREEHWKYTDVKPVKNTLFSCSEPLTCQGSAELQERVNASRLPKDVLIVFVNGRFSQQLSDLKYLSKDVVVCPLSQALQTHEAQVKPYLLKEFDVARYPFASLNTALMMEGLFVAVPKNTVSKHPIHVLYISTEKEFISCPRNIIVAESSSQVAIVEEYISTTEQNYFNNVVTEIHAQANADVQLYKIQNESLHAAHIANVFVEQQQDSRVSTHVLSTGAQLAREDILVNLTHRGAACSLNGVYCLSQDGQVQDNHLHVNHATAHSTSDMLYKGILDKKSRGVFNGKVFVRQDAQQTQSQQSNHSLLLSPTAEMNTKPELEIYADDVKCAHGATIGQLDDESLFYLRARGLSQADATKLLTQAFVTEVTNRIVHADIQAKMNGVLHDKLSQI